MRAHRIAPFRRLLLDWYKKHGRCLPWRRTRDPYRILLSEVMLQQTPVTRVISKYHEFLSKYPTLRDLARASPKEVRKAWRPLGYNIRPFRLHSIAREAGEKYGGEIPKTREELLSFAGIGPYTAGAILSFAFGRRVPILDTNIRRVITRVFLNGQDGHGEKRLWEMSERLLPRRRFYDFNQALMDFGATVCKARRPLCPSCPMTGLCSFVVP